MANVTIPNLTSATTIAPSTDLMVLEQTEGTRKATLSQIFTSSATSGSGLGITSGGVYTIKSGLDSDISDINTLLGDTSIASIGDGTVTGAIDTLNSDLSARKTLYLQSAPTVQQLKDARSVTIICRGQTASPNLPLRLYPELIVAICGYTWDGSQRWLASASYIWSKVNGTITLNSHEEQIASYGLDVIAGWILDF